VKEEYDRTGDNAASIALGLERSGRIITAAALLLAAVFLAFATSGVSFIKLFGVGLALAIAMDATLVRGALAPAFMRLAGGLNWWAPAPLRRLHDRFGIAESQPEPQPAADPAAQRPLPGRERPLVGAEPEKR
jgi:RND superfamily putative drug exporter